MTTDAPAPSHAPGPILAIDVQYKDTETTSTGYAAGVLFDRWDAAAPTHTYTYVHANAEPYVAGSFFKRELPPILALIAAAPVPPRTIVVDGFVDLVSEAGVKPGLGRRLFEHLGGEVVVIGVAKNPFRTKREDAGKDEPTTPGLNTHPGEVFRGASGRALYVTAAGVSQDTAMALVKAMHGDNRQPTMLKLVDRESRDAALRG
ncbi:Endonuclease V [Vanrija pseudolonga]|uniref:Endonuclease V n=1 Tax=Vanrija pseudolonga TaxID=143232 RepID=A0AAF1BL22_9TREE|nr:Endonuclease V [Vanrija pseudolonga]